MKLKRIVQKFQDGTIENVKYFDEDKSLVLIVGFCGGGNIMIQPIGGDHVFFDGKDFMLGHPHK